MSVNLVKLEKGQITPLINSFAESINCPRYVKIISACLYSEGKACSCREKVEND